MSTNTEAVKRPSEIHSVAVNIIPYVKELRLLPSLKSVNACILMRQLEYWFERHPNEFYKFLSPPSQPHRAYQAGKSWTEELGFSEDEFRTAFDQIGVRYKSKKEFDAAGDNRFQGKFYCSYTDKLTHMTYYYRHPVAVDSALDWLVNRELYASASELSETELYVSDAGNSAMSGSWGANGVSPETGESSLDYKETTKETTTEINTDNSLSNLGGDKNFSLSSSLSREEGNSALSESRPSEPPKPIQLAGPVTAKSGSHRPHEYGYERITTLGDLRIDRQLREEYRVYEFDLESELTYFKDYCLAAGRHYADYRSGFKVWLNKKIENDW
jgi:hypothetical protein